MFGSEIGDGFDGDRRGSQRSVMVLSPLEINKTMGSAMAETRERIDPVGFVVFFFCCDRCLKEDSQCLGWRLVMGLVEIDVGHGDR